MKASENKLLMIGGSFIMAVATFGQLQRFQLTDSLALYLQDILLAIWLVLWWYYQGRTWLTEITKAQKIHSVGWSELWKLGKSKWSIALFWILLGWLAASIPTHWSLLLRPWLYIIRLAAAWTFAQCLAQVWPASQQWLARIGLQVAGGLVLFWGLIQFFWLPDTRFLKTFGWDDHYHRLISTLFDPGFAGLLLVMTGLSWIGWQSWKKIPSWVLIIGSLLITGGVLLTYSRASYISLVIGMSWLGWQAWQTRQTKTLVASLLVIVGLFSGMPFLPKPGGEGVKLGRTSTITARIDTNWLALRQLQPFEWIIGRGLFMSKPTKAHSTSEPILPDHAQLPDNLLVLLLSGIGVGGCLVFLKLFARKSWNWWKEQPAWLQSMWLAVLVHSLFNNSLFQPQIWLFLQLWTAFGAVTIAKPRS